MNFKTISLTAENSVCTITITSQIEKNKLDRQMIYEMIEAFGSARDDTRVFVIRGKKDYFCGGGTIGDFRQQSGMEIAEFGEMLGNLLLVMKRCPQPIVACVEGHAHGGGLSIVEACDIVIASEKATFAIPEISGGFCPAIALASVCQILNSKKASELALLGVEVQAKQAEAFGIITEAVSEVRLEARLNEVITKLRNSNPTALRVTKQLQHECRLESFSNQLSLANGTLIKFLTSSDAKENLDCAEQKREPIWANK